MSRLAEFSAQFARKVPEISSGLVVRVHQKIQEGEKSRIQIFEGLVICVSHGAGADATFTVRKVVDGVGVEKIFPLYSTNIAKIDIKKSSNVRKSKLYFMRERRGKSANLRGLLMEIESPVAAPEVKKAEAPAAATEAAKEPVAEAPKAA